MDNKARVIWADAGHYLFLMRRWQARQNVYLLLSKNSRLSAALSFCVFESGFLNRESEFMTPCYFCWPLRVLDLAFDSDVYVTRWKGFRNRSVGYAFLKKNIYMLSRYWAGTQISKLTWSENGRDWYDTELEGDIAGTAYSFKQRRSCTEHCSLELCGPYKISANNFGWAYSCFHTRCLQRSPCLFYHIPAWRWAPPSLFLWIRGPWYYVYSGSSSMNDQLNW